MTVYINPDNVIKEEAMKARLPDLSAALDAALCELHKDMTVDRIDQVLMRLKGAEQSLVAMRRALFEEVRPGHGTG
jgi:hypothetical protein